MNIYNPSHTHSHTAMAVSQQEHKIIHCTCKWRIIKENLALALPTCLTILPMSAYLGSILTDLYPVQMPMIRFVHHVTTSIKSQDVVANTACPTRLYFMFMSEQLLSCKTPAIVKFSMCQHSKQSALSCIYIANNCYSGQHKNKHLL